MVGQAFGGGRPEPLFGPADRRVLCKILPRAQALAGDYYRIPPWKWERTPYDVLTVDDPGGRRSASSEVLAVLDSCTYSSPENAGKPDDTIYRVTLQDPCILGAVRRESRISLEALLLYVLTHELVHIVRFTTAMKDFDSVEDREIEESRVHGVTFQILKNFPNREVGFLLEMYEPNRRPFIFQCLSDTVRA